MKKISIFVLTLMLIAAMAVPAYAVTPGYKIPEVPQISQIKFDIKLRLPEGFWDFIEIIRKPGIPTEGDEGMVEAVARWMP
jgi:hypothetical protein